MNQLILLGIATIMALSLPSQTSIRFSEFIPPKNGGPETTHGSGTRWTT